MILEKLKKPNKSILGTLNQILKNMNLLNIKIILKPKIKREN